MTADTLERRLIQFGVFGCVLSLPVCAIAVLRTNELIVPQILALFWGIVAMGYGVSLIVRRRGWVPARGGMRMLSPGGAAFCGAMYVLIGCIFSGLSWFLGQIIL